MKFKTLLATTIFAVAGLGTSANAAVLSIFDDFSTTTGLRGTIECVSCTVWQGGTSFGAPNGQVFFNAVPASPATEATRVNSLTGTTSFTAGDASQIAGTSGDMTFTSNAEYIWFKIGQDAALVYNTGGLSQFIYTEKNGGAGAGLSHYTEFGTSGGGVIIPSVPLPATLPLFLTALGLGGFSLRRARKHA